MIKSEAKTITVVLQRTYIVRPHQQAWAKIIAILFQVTPKFNYKDNALALFNDEWLSRTREVINEFTLRLSVTFLSFPFVLDVRWLTVYKYPNFFE